jgi:hypothetical protein
MYHDSFFITSHKKTTHFLDTWHSYRLHLIVPAAVAVTRKESASIRIGLIRKDALYSKAPNEDALIPSHGGILLSMELRKNINAYRLDVAWGTDWLETTVVI